MVEYRKNVNLDLIDMQKKFLEENGIEEENGNVLSQIMVLLFEIGSDGKPVSFSRNKKILMHRDGVVEISENELWICQVTMRNPNFGFAKPLRRIEASEILKMEGLDENIVDLVWKGKKDDVVEYLRPKIEEEIKVSLNLRRSQLETEYEGRNSVLDSRYKDLTIAEDDLISNMEEKLKSSENAIHNKYRLMAKELEAEISELNEKMIELREEKKTTVEYYNRENKFLRNKLLLLENNIHSGYTHNERKLPQLPGTVTRISCNEFMCPFLNNGKYSVKINANMTTIRLVNNDYGYAECIDGTIVIPGLDKICNAECQVGALNWKMIDNKTLEISI